MLGSVLGTLHALFCSRLSMIHEVGTVCFVLFLPIFRTGKLRPSATQSPAVKEQRSADVDPRSARFALLFGSVHTCRLMSPRFEGCGEGRRVV